MSMEVQGIMDTRLSLENVFINLGSHVLRFENVEIDPEDTEKARRELRETSEIVQESLQKFRELIKQESGLKYPTNDDLKLQIFLRPCKYYPASALDRMKKFYKFKHKYPVYSKNLTPKCEKRAFLQNLLTILPYRNKNGERILLVEAGKKWDTKNCTLNEIFRSVMIILEAALEEPKTQINGVQVILDMNGFSLQHVWQFSATFAKHAVDWVQDCIPIRLKGIHVVNQPYVFNMVYALFKQFLGEKIQKRLIIHGSNFENLHNYISPSVLPKEYGGNLEIPLTKGQLLHEYLAKYDVEFQVIFNTHKADLRVLYFHLRHLNGIDRVPELPFAHPEIECFVGNDGSSIYWNCPLPTPGLLAAKKPDIVLLSPAKRTHYGYSK